jgi:hypothetical protein
MSHRHHLPRFKVARLTVTTLLALLLLAVASSLVLAAVSLTYFELVPGLGSGQVAVLWGTETEVDVAAFQIRRNDVPVLSTAQVVHLEPGRGSAVSGADYEWMDSGLVPGQHYYYWLYDITTSGTVEFLASDDVVASGASQPYLFFLPTVVGSS